MINYTNIHPIDQAIVPSLLKFFYPSKLFVSGDTGACETCNGHGRIRHTNIRPGFVCRVCGGDGWNRRSQ